MSGDEEDDLEFVQNFIIPIIRQTISEVKEAALEQKKKQFKNRGANDWDDTLFPKLQDSTVEIKKAKNVFDPEQPLFDTGDLFRQLKLSDSESLFKLEDDSVHAKYADRWLRFKGARHDYKEFSDAEWVEIGKMLAEKLESGLQ